MVVGVTTLELHLPAAGSLKQKRQVVKSLKERLRSRYNVALVESSEHADRWQRADVTITSISEERSVIERLFETIRREAESQVPGYVMDGGSDFLELDDDLSGGWIDEDDGDETTTTGR